ncbi:NupC/NupG family nucleoside CNT transporter [Luteolibacter pohnpeiensis]|uniref:Nucleoside permease n=2 Tax=Luteolibacter pohnpeiensis TaxID=454153 RepID=A0A934VWQ9_9BACT|nr:NupC/NupG family nucleoside CNT transporter [Luteolibacter pohnpeiensis]MBK1882769.1 NupC/NupG family nucleoside CNT transporter [Luteolibacter pohnpeiensis]
MVALLGILLFLAIAYFACDNRKAINWRTVGVALALQIGIGAFVFGVPQGRSILELVSDRVSDTIGAGKAGVDFLFGPLSQDGSTSLGFIFAFRVLPMIIFFSSLIAVLYHLGIMQKVILILGGGLRAVLKTSRAESMSAAANIFVGQTEAPLIVKPYISRMTQSELFAVMVGGLASIAGSVLASYAAIGVDMKFLISASFMAAPGGLLYAKLMKPEVDKPRESRLDFAEGDEKPANVVDAAALGAASGLKLALNVGAMLLAFVGLIALINLLLGGIGNWIHHPSLSLQEIFGFVFSPVAWATGIPWSEASQGGTLIGQKLALNEFVAYFEFIQYKSALTPKSQAICSVALCGFANLSSIAILLGGLGSMAPNRRADIARLGMKAVLAGTLSNLTSAAIVGFFIS